jgi:Uma2 family endonuclease
LSKNLKAMGYALTINGLTTQNLKIVANDMSEDDFFDFCQKNRNLRIERDADKTIKIMEPTGSESGYTEMEVSSELRNWSKEEKSGIAFSPSAGFTMPTGAVRASDASWLTLEKWLTLPAADRKKFAHVCPDFIVEVRSESDDLTELKEKMTEWINNGVRLAWLIDPKTHISYVYRADGSIDIIRGFDKKLSGEDVLKGFELDLSLLILPE